ARLATSLAQPRIAEESIDGQRYWCAPSNPPSSAARGGAYVLPAFDEILVGYTDRSAALDPSHATAVLAGGIFNPVVVVDGGGVGTWKRRLGKREVVCSIAPFATLKPSKTRAVTDALKRYAGFLGLGLRREDGAPSR